MVGEEKEINIFPCGICPKLKVIARLRFELAYYDIAIQRFNHYTTRLPNPRLIGLVGGVFSNSPGDRGSIPGNVLPKT